MWIASLSSAIVVASVGASAVLAEGPACVVNGEPITQEQLAADPSLCPDPGTTPPPADPAPEPTPPAPPAPTEPAPTPDPAAPTPSTPTTDPAATPPTSAEPTPAAPTPTTPVQETTPATPAPPRPIRATRPAANTPPADTTQHTTGSDHEHEHVHAAAKHYQAAPFRDARVFREHYTPKGRIPEQPKLPTAEAQLLIDAAKGTGTSWAMLTAVAWIESRWNDPAAGGIVGRRLTPAAWKAYGTDGDGDGTVSRASAADQARTVAVYLSTARPTQVAALRAYFRGAHSVSRAGRAKFLADYYDALGIEALTKGIDDPAARQEIEDRILANEDVTIYDGGRSDIDAGLIDPRVLVTVEFLANRFGTAAVSSLVSGHGVFTAGGNISLHSYGQAVDIAALGGESILGHQQRGGRTYRAVRELLLLPEAMQPAELITLWDMGLPSFAAADHDDHIHIGFKTETGPAPSGVEFRPFGS